MNILRRGCLTKIGDTYALHRLVMSIGGTEVISAGLLSDFAINYR